MRQLKYVLQSKTACFVVSGTMLVLFWGAGIYNIYQESQGSMSDLSELWSYISEQGLMFLIGLLASVSFLISGFQAKKASEADKAANSRIEYGYSGMANGACEMAGAGQLTNEFSLQSGARKIRFDLPQRYRLVDGEDGDPAFAGFNEELKPELIYCSLQEAIDDETAEDYVLDELVEDEDCPEELRTRSFMRQEMIDGRLYYYYLFKFKKSRRQRQKFAAACDIGGGLFYTIETEWIGRKEELTLDALMDFLKIRVE